MIDREDFPQLTPEQRLARAKRLMQLPNMAAVEEEGRKVGERIDYLFKKYIVGRNNIDPRAMSLDALLQRFEEICLVADEVRTDPFEDGTQKYNECYDALEVVHQELKARGPDARRALMRFYNHYNYEVRLKAAKLTYRIAPEAARRCLEALEAQTLLPQALDAGMTLYAIYNGTSMLD